MTVKLPHASGSVPGGQSALGAGGFGAEGLLPLDPGDLPAPEPGRFFWPVRVTPPSLV